MSIASIETEEKKVYIFIDNSNVFIEGKYSVGQHERLGTIDKKRRTRYYDLVRIEHGQLLEIVQNGRPLGANPFLVGSKPPSEDSVWKYIRRLGFDVTVYKRNSQDREKKVDVTLGCAMQKAIDKNSPGILILIAGDGDYEWPITEAIENNWKVEVWFWKSGMKIQDFSKPLFLPALKPPLGYQLKCSQNDAFFTATSNDLQKTDFHQLDYHYKFFTYGDGYSPNEKVHALKLIDKKLEEWTNREAMQSFIRLDLFSRLKWENSTTLYLYFKEQDHADSARKWLDEQYELEVNEIIM